MKSVWNRTDKDGQHPPVEMRFVDMFMTALGSLVFIALLLVFLLPATVDVFVSGRVTAKDGGRVTIATAQGEKKVLMEPHTPFRRHIPMPTIDLKVGEEVFAAGSAAPKGPIRASMLEAALDTNLAEKVRFVFFSGIISAQAGSELTVTTQDGYRKVLLDQDTKYIRSLGATPSIFSVGKPADIAGRVNSDGTVTALTMQSPPERDPIPELEAKVRQLTAKVEELERQNAEQAARIAQLEQEVRRIPELEARIRSLIDERDRLKSENERLTKENARLKEQLAELQRMNANMEHRDIRKRWLSVQLVLRGCVSENVFFYVRTEGKLVSMQDGSPQPDAIEFDASKIINAAESGSRRELIFGDAYGSFSWDQPGDSIVLFNTVARGQTSYAVYVALTNPLGIGDRECLVFPVFSSFKGPAVVGDRITLTKSRPFAWVRRFQVNQDGSSTAFRKPKDDPEFLKELETFSYDQSKRLCDAVAALCNAVDAHWYAIRPPASFNLHRNKAFNWSGRSYVTTAENLEDCQRRCLTSESCSGYSYFRKLKDSPLSQMCRLMDGPGHELIDESRAESGVKEFKFTDTSISSDAVSPNNVLSCERESALRSASTNSSRPTYVNFVNRRSTPIALIWLDRNGKRVFYQNVSPGSSHRQHTFPGHPWVVTTSDGKCIQIIMPEDAERIAYIR